METIHIKQYGKPEHLLAAFAALESVPEKNVVIGKDFGQPFTVAADGKCKTVCNPAGWVAQHPHFKSLGVKFEQAEVMGKPIYVPQIKPDGAKILALGYNALAHAMEMDIATVNRIFSPHFYPEPWAKVSVKEVLRRLKTIIGKAGGADALKAHLKSRKAKVKPAKTAKTAKKAKKAA